MTEVTLASNITTATSGPTAGVQPYGSTQPIIIDIFGKAIGTSGAQNIIFTVQESVDNSTWTTAATMTLAGTFTSKPFAVQVKISKALVRVTVGTITGTGAALYAEARIP